MKTIRVTVRTTVCPRVAMATRSNPSIHSHFGSGRQGGSGFERLDRPKENLLNQAGRVDFLQESAVAVVLDQRGGLFLVGLNSFPHDILAVVGANHEGRPALVADAGLLRRVHEDVIDGVVLRAHPSSRVPFDQLLRLQEQVHGRVEVRELREGFGLGDRPREAVEDESLFRIFVFQAAFCHRNDEFVRHEFSGVHVCLRLLPEFGALGHTVTEDVPRGDSRYTQVCRELRSLRALAGSGRPEEDEAHEGQRTDSAVKRLATPRLALSDNEDETRTSIEKECLHRPQSDGLPCESGSSEQDTLAARRRRSLRGRDTKSRCRTRGVPTRWRPSLLPSVGARMRIPQKVPRSSAIRSCSPFHGGGWTGSHRETSSPERSSSTP